MEEALHRLCEKAESAVKGGSAVLVLSDRGVSPEQAPYRACSPRPPSTTTWCGPAYGPARRCRRDGRGARGTPLRLLVGYGATAVNPTSPSRRWR